MRSPILLACGVSLISICTAHAADLQSSMTRVGDLPATKSRTIDHAASQKGWSFSLGGGGGIAPKYEGSKTTEFTAVPVASAQWRSAGTWGTTIFAGTGRGIGVSYGNEAKFIFGANLAAFGERKENEDRRLRGLGDVKTSATAGVFLAVPFGPIDFSINTQSALDGNAGTTVTFGFGSGFPITDRLSIGANVGATWADADYMTTYFSITSRQAARSQAGLKRFNAKAGIKSIDLGVDATYNFTPVWSLNLSGGVSTLVGDAARSPISERDVQPSVSLTVVRTF